MKHLILSAIFALSIGSIYAQSPVKASTQEVTPNLVQQREALKQEIITSYLNIKENLVASDSVQASKSAANLANALGKFKFKKLNLEEMNAATNMRGKLKELAMSIASTKNINKQRTDLNELSVGMWDIIAYLTPAQTALYEQKCPMTGKVWISSDKEIKNPYFPKNMLDCGEVIASAGTAKP